MKYMGSKNRLAKELLPLILSGRGKAQYYVEPFSGGCNMIDKVEGPRIANDSNQYLQAFWERFVYTNWEPRFVNKTEYKYFRDHAKNGTFPSTNRRQDFMAWVGWAGICCSYRGKWFGGYAGKVTTASSGKVRNYQAEALRNVKKQRDALLGVRFHCNDYRGFYIPDKSIVYCDPPYLGTTGYNSDFDHVAFWNWARDLAKKGHSVYVSEYQAPGDFQCVATENVKSSLSNNGTSGAFKNSLERLFVYRGCTL